jgi:uncharacterized metal-binding protein YceD (DUF177 family)
VAKLAGVIAVPKLRASFDVTRQGAEGLRVAGNIGATVTQTCVVTLDPIDNEIAETVDLVFLPAGERIAAAGERSESDADIAPETMTDGTVDLGAVTTEFVILGIDPYPRKPGAVFEPPAAADEGSHPFAALEALRKKDRGPQR